MSEEKIDFQCPGCESNDLEQKIMTDSFKAVIDGNEETLNASLPVICCKHCNEAFTDFRAEEIKDTMVRNLQIKVL